MTRWSARVRKLLRILVNSRLRRAFIRYRVAMEPAHLPTLRRLGTLHTIVDVGANRGQFALTARYCFPYASIVSFEPLPAPAAIYRDLFADDAGVTLHDVAIGPHSERTTIHVSRRDHSSSLLPIAPAQSEIFPGTEEVGTATVAMAPLSAFLTPDAVAAPALLKLDVQGFELQALMGCESLLPSFAWIYVECSLVELYRGQALANEVSAWLRQRGWVERGVYNVARDAHGRPVQADYLFERREG